MDSLRAGVLWVPGLEPRGAARVTCPRVVTRGRRGSGNRIPGPSIDNCVEPERGLVGDPIRANPEDSNAKHLAADRHTSFRPNHLDVDPRAWLKTGQTPNERTPIADIGDGQHMPRPKP